MAPIPSHLPPETQETVLFLSKRQKDIFDFQINRLRSCSGPLVTQQQYAAELREDVETFARRLESLESSVDELHVERGRRDLRKTVQEFQDALSRMRKESRSALLTSKRAIDASRVSNREELLRVSAVTEKQDLNEKVTEDALMEANNNVTEALQRTIALMQKELEKSVLSSQLLDASTAALKSTSSTHDVLDSFMVTSKHLITALEKSDWLDRLLILFALLFFILVVLFILKQRLVDRSLRIAFFWMRFLPSSVVKSADTNVLNVMEKGVVGTAMTTGVTTATSAAVSTTSLVTAMASVFSMSTQVSGTALPVSSTDSADSSTSLLESLYGAIVDHVPIDSPAATPPEDSSEPERTTVPDISNDSRSADVHTHVEL